MDLNGTSGEGRLSLLAGRAAPVQATWIGAPNTTGLPTVDYRIVDARSDPPPGAQEWNTEELLDLPRLFSVYDPLRRQLLDGLRREGVGPERIDLVGRIPRRDDHLKAYGRIDVQLDTFPYHGTTTTCESLLMDATGFTAELEAAWRRCWAGWCEANPA